jgi:glycosyltransferase involved in cell wall biosynthesis/Flp pilus assembly protein TadD
MVRRCLVGPVSRRFADRHLLPFRRAGQCLAFGPGGPDLVVRWGDSWEDVGRRLPAGWQPDFILLCLAYSRTPPGLASAPVPVIGHAPDWPLLWHALRRQAAWCDRVWTDPAGAGRLAAAGCGHARAVLPFGLAAGPDDEPPGRDVDLLCVGNFNPAIHRDRWPWLARLARLGDRRKVVVHEDVDADRCRPLLRRARIVFQHSLHRAWDGLTPAVLAAGALLFRDATGGEPLPGLVAGREYVAYTADDLESLLKRYLADESARQEIAAAGRARAGEFRTDRLWPRAVAGLDAVWDELAELARRRAAAPRCPHQDLITRAWQAVGAAPGTDDADLVRELGAAVERTPEWAEGCNALGVLLGRGAGADGEQAAALFARAWSGSDRHAPAGLHLVEALARLGRREKALRPGRALLASLRQDGALPAAVLDAVPAPPGFDVFRVEWERAAWQHAGQADAEVAAKRDLLLYRLHLALAGLAGDPAHRHEALGVRPDLPMAAAALGRQLARAGRYEEAAPHLERALAAAPFDAGLARQLFETLGRTGRGADQERLAAERRLLARAFPARVRPEDWFASTQARSASEGEPSPFASASGLSGATQARSASEGTRFPLAGASGLGGPAPAGRVSLCMIVRNEEHNLPRCLDSVRDLVAEAIVVDTGSTDRTPALAAERGARVVPFAWCDDFAAARNEGLRHASGDWIFWLDADESLDETNRCRLRELFARLRDENAAYLMRQLSRSADAVGATTAVDQVRLFRRRPDVRWEYRIHEQILLAVRRSGADVRRTDIVIDHFGYQDSAVRQGKLERNLRLLELSHRERPEDPILAFNLAWALQKTGRPDEALRLLEQCRDRLPPEVSIVPKVYRLLGQIHQQAGRTEQALTAFRTGRALFPNDVELRLHEGLLRRQLRDYAGAEACLKSILTLPATACLGGLDLGLRGYKTRHALAELYLEQRRYADAEAEWRAVVAEQPGFGPAWRGLEEVQRQKQESRVQKPDTVRQTRLIWEGPQRVLHSYARVNRAICARLQARGHELSLRLDDARLGEPATAALPPSLEACVGRPLSGPAAVHVRHQWPPDFRPPPEGHWVVMQSWEYGSLPRAWLRPLTELVDEVWVPTRFVRDGFVGSGVPADRVHVVPFGIDPARFHPGVRPLALATAKRFNFLFVGGTIRRKGIDLLLSAYADTFTAADDVCLIIKDLGVGTYYGGQTAGDAIARLRERPGAPAVEYLDRPLGEDELAGLYAACDCLVQPYRGEGFGLPIAEAMACGRPVIVTGYGAALDFCTAATAYLLPARPVRFPDRRVGRLETVDHPWLAQPSLDALRQALRHAAAHPEEGKEKGQAAAAAIRGAFTWEHTAAVVAARLEALRGRGPRRRQTGTAPVLAVAMTTACHPGESNHDE